MIRSFRCRVEAVRRPKHIGLLRTVVNPILSLTLRTPRPYASVKIKLGCSARAGEVNVWRSMPRFAASLSLIGVVLSATVARGAPPSLDERLSMVLRGAGFTGRVESTLEARLGRSVDAKLANLGRLLWFDKLHSLHHDNTCGGCHSPTNGFGDTQSIAIGVQNNNVVGPRRAGPRNQRRTPMAINTAFHPQNNLEGPVRPEAPR